MLNLYCKIVNTENNDIPNIYRPNINVTFDIDKEITIIKQQINIYATKSSTFTINNNEFIINTFYSILQLQNNNIYTYTLINNISKNIPTIKIYANTSMLFNNIAFNTKYGEDNDQYNIYAKFVCDDVNLILMCIMSIIQQKQCIFIKGINKSNNIIEFYCPVNIEYILNNPNEVIKKEQTMIIVSYNITRNTCTIERTGLRLNETNYIHRLEIPISLNKCYSIQYDHTNHIVKVIKIKNTHIQNDIIQHQG